MFEKIKTFVKSDVDMLVGFLQSQKQKLNYLNLSFRTLKLEKNTTISRPVQVLAAPCNHDAFSVATKRCFKQQGQEFLETLGGKHPKKP